MVRASGPTEQRLASLYDAEGFGGEKTMRAKVIRELIDKIRLLRAELLQAGTRSGASDDGVDGQGTAADAGPTRGGGYTAGLDDN